MFYRQKILLALIEVFGGRLNSRDLQKYMFLFTVNCQNDKSYEFVPYKDGGFSFQSYADRKNLTIAGHLIEDDDWFLKETGYLKNLKKGDTQKLINFYRKYKKQSGNELIREVYIHYPYYAINSQIAEELLDKSELKVIHSKRPQNIDKHFFTIGYEGNSFEHYLNRLIKNNVKLLCDVRRNPLSRKFGFSKKMLSETLNKLGIEYLHISELGIASNKRQQLEIQEDYDRLFDEYERTTLANNSLALEELMVLTQKYNRIAITCFEAEVCMCHRGRVAKALSKLPEWDVPIKHI